MRMTYEFQRFVFECEYDERDIPKQAHFYWDSRRKAWVTHSLRWASKLLRYADEDCKRRITDRIVGQTPEPAMFKPGNAGRYGSQRRRA